jgi:PAS domain S-box-containing protein
MEAVPVERTTNHREALIINAFSNHAVYMIDSDGRILTWNSGAERINGYKAEEIIGQHFSIFYPAEAAESAQQFLALAIPGGFETEGWRVRKDGNRFWGSTVLDPIRDATGAMLGYAVMTRDRTGRREAEDALRRSEQQFKFLVQGVTDYAIYMLDPAGNITNWNSGAERIKGYEAGEIIGQHFSRFYTEQDRGDGVPQKALATAEREGKFETENWRVRKDGTQFMAHVVIDALRSEDGQLIGFAKITRDITERKRQQRELEKAREALFHSQKTEAIGRLTGGIAHDFNNLLMAIMGSLELLAKRLPEGDQRSIQLVSNAMLGARRGASLTQRMLAFARRQEVELAAVDLGELVRGMSDLLEDDRLRHRD